MSDWPPTNAEMTGCLVLGAGLAGACAAYALARQGRRVVLVDAAAAAAQGASALPVGLMAPRKQAGAQAALPQQPDWDAQGMACTRRWLEDFSAQGLLVPGQDWQACGSAHSTAFAKKQTKKQGKAAQEQEAWRWQPEVCWIKPQRLVAACLQQPSIRCVWQAQASALQALGDGWQMLLADGRVLRARQLVLAASVGSSALLRGLPQGAAGSALRRLQDKNILNATAGQAIYAPWQRDWDALLPLTEHAPHACNGHGHFVPAVSCDEASGGDFWLSGATYVHEATAEAANTDAGQAENVQRLIELLPPFAPALQRQGVAGKIQRFVGVRCTTPTRLPVVAQLAHGLWLSAGFGSRGLSHAPLAAEWLAGQMSA